MQKVISTTDTISVESSNLDDSITCINQSLYENTLGIQQVSQGSTEQAKAVDEINEKVRMVSGEIEEANRKMDNMRKSVKDTEVRIADGLSIVTQLGDNTEVNLSVFKSLVDTIQLLTEDMKAIGALFEGVTAISRQINLLALNASIESARAGNAGQGFAIIAMEINKLAQQAAQNTATVEQIIHKVNANIEKTKTEVSTMQTALEQQGRSVRNTEDVFNAINEVAVGLLNDLKYIDSALHNVNTSAAGCVKTVSEVLNITTETTAIMEELAASSEEQSASMEQIKESMSRLNELSRILKELTRKFTV